MRGSPDLAHASKHTLYVSSSTDETTITDLVDERKDGDIETLLANDGMVITRSKIPFLGAIGEKMGSIDESRFAFPEYNDRKSDETGRLFSSLVYNKKEGSVTESSLRAGSMSSSTTSVSRQAGSVLGAAALVAGTTVGAGVLALPAATASTGFLTSTAALTSAWIYMTMSGLLIAELTLNRMVNTGKPGLGLLELYSDSLGKPWSLVGSAAYFFLHYAMLVAYISQGGNNLGSFVGLNEDGSGQVIFAAMCGLALFTASSQIIEMVNNVLVLGVGISFALIIGLGAGTTDWAGLIDPANQHPDQVVGCLPILFLSLVYQNVVPTVVTQLEGDRDKISKSIIAGTTAPFLMFILWNAVVLGNVGSLGSEGGVAVDPLALLQSNADGNLGPLVSTFSSLALVTSIIGFTYGLLDAWTDLLKIDRTGPEFQKQKVGLFALLYLPPLALALGDPGIFFKALDYGGAFGVSTLFLVLPPLMVWKQRYQTDEPLITKPMVPFGKIPLGSMWKVAATLIIEQGAEKLGVIDFFKDNFLS